MRIKTLACAAAAIIFFTGATYWEGDVAVDSSVQEPLGAPGIASKAFPKNTVVDVTNLETHNTVRVVVASEVSTSGLLATLSPKAAAALNFNGDSVYRIRMTQPSDDVAFSFLRQYGLEGASAVPAGNPEQEFEITDLALHTSEERIPESGAEHEISHEDIVPPIQPREYEYVEGIAPKETISIAAEDPPAPPVNFSPFQAPLITELDSSRWYVQVAAYTRTDYVEDEISRLGTDYPLAVQNIGTDAKPLFRILLGPLNQGESGAILQRIKSVGYPDAFIRRN